MVKYDLKNILPHKAPMILIDELLEVDLNTQSTKASVTIDKNKLFFDEKINGISPLVGIEYMAQTIGCHMFFANGQQKPEIGFLLGSRMYKNSLEKFELNKTYIISVSQIFSDNQLVSFECFIYNDNMQQASAVVNIYLPHSKEELQNINI